MHHTQRQRSSRTTRRFSRSMLAGGLLLSAFLQACSGGGGGAAGAAMVGNFGERAEKPGGGAFYIDNNFGGGVSRLGIVGLSWGRVVNVHDFDPATGEPSEQPIFTDMVVRETVQTDGINYRLDINPITQEARLIVLRVDGAPDTGNGTFDSLVREAQENLPSILPKGDDGSFPEPFSFIARNATLVVQFNDLLASDAVSEARLPETVRVLVGYPPILPFDARLRFDPNWGGVVGGAFHSTRVLVDMTVSAAELATMATPVPLNSLGLPASLPTTRQPNVALRFPTDTDPSQTVLLRSLGGAPLDNSDNGPVDFTTPTRDLVRAMRAGNAEDFNNGFQVDLNPPEIVGGFPLSVTAAIDDAGGDAGFDFLVNLRFTSTVCQIQPEVGDIVSVAGILLEVTSPAGIPDSAGDVVNVSVRVQGETPQAPVNLIDAGVFQSTFDPAAAINPACWVSISPPPADFPDGGVRPNAQILLRFSEAMDPDSINAFETFQVVPANADPSAQNITVANIQASVDLREHRFAPVLAFAHQAGTAEPYDVLIDSSADGVTDLAGNGLVNPLRNVEFSLDPNAGTRRTGNISLRFDDTDEWQGGLAALADDFRGQFFYDFDRGVIRPRSVARLRENADRSNPVPSIMTPFAPGVQTPLSPLGSKLQTLWRYCDFGWLVDDETKYNLDVEGLSWSPIGGQVVADFYEEFEVRLAHSNRMPDEYIDLYLLPDHPTSGLNPRTVAYRTNILPPANSQQIVHTRDNGYVVNPVDLFENVNGTPLMPFPWNRGLADEDKTRFLWRDTADLRTGGANGSVSQGVGVPLSVEAQQPLRIYGNNLAAGDLYPRGRIPTIGLPLLMEFRCYPTSQGIGLNAFDINLAINTSPLPNFRSYSTGGINSNNQPVEKNPDLETNPTGGFNPSMGGTPTALATDNSFYLGQLEAVVRVSRVHSVFFDTGSQETDYAQPVVLPPAAQQPQGTSIAIDFRGGRDFNPVGEEAAQNSRELDPYGDIKRGAAIGLLPQWGGDINRADGRQFLQVRLSFINNIFSNLNAELSALGIAYEIP